MAKLKSIKTDNSRTILDVIVTALTNEQTGSMFLDDCTTIDPNLVKKIPLRYRIIAFGFARGLSLEKLNELLNANGCAKLYSRSLWEASLIYAFANHLSYQEWQDLRDECAKLRDRKELQDPFFQDKSISLKNLKDYLDANSNVSESHMSTQHLTGMMDRKIAELSFDKMEFKDFLVHNIMLLSPIREKCRYYFCKYLYYYLISHRDQYLHDRVTSSDQDELLSELAMFKGLRAIRRKKMSDDELTAFLDTSGISLGEIFDAFNYYYFNYVSLDWMEVLLEYYGNIGDMPADDKQELAASLRKYDPNKYSGLSDDEVLELKQKEIDRQESDLDELYSIGGSKKAYQMNRAGENTIRKYIKGSLDIDRASLICFLLFFGNNSQLPPDMKITQWRLDMILSECGFPVLRSSDEFDDFVLGYIESQDPDSYLMDLVTDYAMDEENFFLYRMYRASRNAEEDLLKLTSVK